MILTIRTDKPEAELGLYDHQAQIDYVVWHAHRELSATIHSRIESLLHAHQLSLTSLRGIICYKGPGSFTGLRIGLTVGNALASSLRIPIVSQTGDEWIERGIQHIEGGADEKITLPEYGMDVHITEQKR